MRIQLITDGLYLACFRFAASAHDDSVGPQQGELARFVELRKVDFQETLHTGNKASCEIAAGQA